MLKRCVICALLGVAISLIASCTYPGGERAKHEIKRADGLTVTCFEPPPEIVKKANIATDLELSKQEIGALAKASVRGEVTPERIREKLPSNVAAYEVIEFRLCVDYANGVYSPEEYRAFVEAKSGLPLQKERKSPLKEGVSVDSAREQLLQFIEEGNHLTSDIDADPIKVEIATKQKVNTWIKRVETYLQDNLERSYLVRFKVFSDLPPPGVPSFQSYGIEWLGVRAGVMHRLTRLNQFLDTIY